MALEIFPLTQIKIPTSELLDGEARMAVSMQYIESIVLKSELRDACFQGFQANTLVWTIAALVLCNLCGYSLVASQPFRAKCGL